MLSILAVIIVYSHIGCAYVTDVDNISSNVQTGYNVNDPSQRSKSLFLEPEQIVSARYQRDMKADPNEKSCPKSKPIIKKAFSKCSTKTQQCTVQCMNKYQFTNGKTSIKLLCNSGVWTFEGFEKNDKPACEPVCNPPCKNDGVCKRPGICSCPENFDGAQCEKPINNCTTQPESNGSEMTCGPSECTISCIEDYYLPDGSSEMKMVCKDSRWMPKNEEQTFEPNCEPMCEDGRKYKECSQTPDQSCGALSEDVTASSSECLQGCFCPDGQVEYDGNCIPPEQCPMEMISTRLDVMNMMDSCTLEGQTYETGTIIQRECSTCICENGEWNCMNEGCSARCEVYGDPHYKTFDGKRFDFMGKCSYYLMKADNGMEIITENGDCPPGFSKNVACVKSVTVNVANDYTLSDIHLMQGAKVVINGIEAAIHRPIIIGLGRSIWIGRIGPMAVMLLFKDGLQLTWDGFTYAYIDAPPSYHNRTMGLCGNFDSIPDNDMKKPDGKMEQSQDKFGNEWRVKELCDPKNEKANVSHPCDTNKENKNQALKTCAMLKSNIFQECEVDPEPYYNDCMYDMCACQGDRAMCMCTIFVAYGNECGRQGKPVQWREKIPECAMKNPAGPLPMPGTILEAFINTGGNDELSVEPVARNADPMEEDNEPTENDNNIPKKDTKPTESATETVEKDEQPTGSNSEMSEKNTEPTEEDTEPTEKNYESKTEQDQATEAETEETEINTEPTDIGDDESTEKDKKECSNENNQPDEPKTCSNMNNNKKKQMGMCKEGCACKNGYVLNEDLGQCVKPELCSCERNGKIYQTGDHVEEGCRACICKETEWYCSDKKCKLAKKIKRNLK